MLNEASSLDLPLDLKARRDALVQIIQSIEAQLSQKDKSDLDGRRLSDSEYHDWRARAIAKRRHLLGELREVKAELARRGEQEHLERKAQEQSQMTRIERKLDLLLNHFNIELGES